MYQLQVCACVHSCVDHSRSPNSHSRAPILRRIPDTGYSYKSHDSFNKFSLEYEYMRAHKVQYDQSDQD